MMSWVTAPACFSPLRFQFAKGGANPVPLKICPNKVFPLEPGYIMSIKLINIGFGNIVSANRIIAIVSPESAPIKRVITEGRDRGMLVDATYGRRTRAVIITDSGHVILSAVQPETVKHRLQTKEPASSEEGSQN